VAARPLIGVSTSELRSAEGAHFAHQSEPPRRMLALGMAYMEALEAAGAIPVILAPLPAREIEPLLDRLDGVCLSGGPDIDPIAYGGSNHPELGPTEREVDEFEIALVRAVQRRGLPLLAICRGLQVLNVARGGTLIQHLPDVVGPDVEHRQRDSARVVTHAVDVARHTTLHRLMEDRRPLVNSFHHQAVDRIGQGLRAVAWSDDQIVEALEAPGGPFTVAVQWHAECLTERAEHAALFSGLVDAARMQGSLAAERAA
jgi:putative glutamine amidotransferase